MKSQTSQEARSRRIRELITDANRPQVGDDLQIIFRIPWGHNKIILDNWNMDNIFIRTDPVGNIKADKEKSTEKIDGAIATIMALDRAIRCGNEVTESVYDTRGLLVFKK